jgi:hypothetical protein
MSVTVRVCLWPFSQPTLKSYPNKIQTFSLHPLPRAIYSSPEAPTKRSHFWEGEPHENPRLHPCPNLQQLHLQYCLQSQTNHHFHPPHGPFPPPPQKKHQLRISPLAHPHRATIATPSRGGGGSRRGRDAAHFPRPPLPHLRTPSPAQIHHNHVLQNNFHHMPTSHHAARPHTPTPSKTPPFFLHPLFITKHPKTARPLVTLSPAPPSAIPSLPKLMV